MSAAARPGMAAPVWLTSAAVTPAGECVHDLALAFAGIVSLGVADSAASAVGRRFGRHRILGTRKTIEGTLGGIALTLAAWAVIWPLCRCGATAAGHVGILAQARTAQPVRTLRGSLRARAPAGCLHDALSTLARMRLKQAGGWRPARQLATIVSAWDIMTPSCSHFLARRKCACAQCCFVVPGQEAGGVALWPLVFATVASCLLEAATTQLDNIFLPLHHLAMLAA